MSSRTKKNDKKSKESNKTKTQEPINISDDDTPRTSFNSFKVDYNGVQMKVTRVVADGRLLGYCTDESGITDNFRRIEVNGTLIGYFANKELEYILGDKWEYEKLKHALQKSYDEEVVLLNNRYTQACFQLEAREREATKKHASTQQELMELNVRFTELMKLSQEHVVDWKRKDETIMVLQNEVCKLSQRPEGTVYRNLKAANHKLSTEIAQKTEELNRMSFDVHQELSKKEMEFAQLFGEYTELAQMYQDSTKKDVEIAQLKREYSELAQMYQESSKNDSVVENLKAELAEMAQKLEDQTKNGTEVAKLEKELYEMSLVFNEGLSKKDLEIEKLKKKQSSGGAPKNDLEIATLKCNITGMKQTLKDVKFNHESEIASINLKLLETTQRADDATFWCHTLAKQNEDLSKTLRVTNPTGTIDPERCKQVLAESPEELAAREVELEKLRERVCQMDSTILDLKYEVTVVSGENETLKNTLMATELVLDDLKAEKIKLEFGLSTLKSFGAELFKVGDKRVRENDQDQGNKRSREDDRE